MQKLKCKNKNRLPISPIELLEYSKRNVSKVRKWNDLPDDISGKLLLAISLLEQTQEYLFYN